jgi:hypothetical protein
LVQSQPRQIVLQTLCKKKPTQKRAGGVTQGIGPKFKPRYQKKKKKKERRKEGRKGKAG